MTLEASDFNDGSILAATRMETGPNDAIRLRITLASGREVVSEWVAPENKKRALFAWCETIREQAATDAQSAAREAREKAAEAKARADRAQSEAAQAPSTTPQQTASAPSEPAASAHDPLEYAKAMLEDAARSRGYWQEVADDAFAKARDANARMRKWAAIVKGLEDGNDSTA